MLVRLQSWWAILLTVLVTARGSSLRSIPPFSEPPLPAEDEKRVSEAAPIIDERARGRHGQFSALDTSSSAERAGSLGAASAYASVGNPFAWLFGSSPVTPMGSPGSVSPVMGYQFAPAVAPAAWQQPVVMQQPLASPSSMLMPMTPAPTASPETPPPPQPPAMVPITLAPAAVSPQEVAQMRAEIAGLRAEVANGQRDMFDAARLITATVEKDEKAMQALTSDVQTLRGRHAGSVPVVTTECSVRQSSCSECLSVPSCVWCKVEQRCYSGDELGPVRGECAFFRHGTCS